MSDPRLLTQREAQERLVATLERNETLIRDFIGVVKRCVQNLKNRRLHPKSISGLLLKDCEEVIARAKRERSQ